LETFRRPIADARAKFGYARVSTREQNPDHRVDALLRAGVPEKQIYIGEREASVAPEAGVIH
jgi:DNA invertase Pin-like site-specific DNA recombinase